MNLDFSTDSSSFWITLIIRKNLKGENNNNNGGPGSVGNGGGSSGGTNGLKNSDRNLFGDDVIKTDKTQEETEITQEITNENGGLNENLNYEISPYPFEMLNRVREPIKTGTKRSRQQHHRRPSSVPQQQLHHQHQHQQQHQRLSTPQNNEMDSISQTQTTIPRQPPASEVVSKPLSEKEKIPFKEKSQAKPSLDLPLGTDTTQSAVCSTQPSHLPTENITNTNNNNNNNLQSFNNGGDNNIFNDNHQK
uniref:Uncharacterized protein n=1 Tax=Panagrolaimus sp. ES5 TaxID=591445 RepID=A0AC34FCS7_9BILA